METRLQMVTVDGRIQRNGWLDISTEGGTVTFEQTSPFGYIHVSRTTLDLSYPLDLELSQISVDNFAWTVEIGGHQYQTGVVRGIVDDSGPRVETYLYDRFYGDRRQNSQFDLISMMMWPDVVRFSIRKKHVVVPELAWRVQLAMSYLAHAHLMSLPSYLTMRARATEASA